MAMNSLQSPRFGKQTGSPFNPDYYPPGRLPALTTAELVAISQQGRLPTAQELDAVLRERQRALDKIEWVIETGRPDRIERISSATATTRTTFSLDALTVAGRNYRERQKKVAARPRSRNDPLNRAILKILRGNPYASARDVWNALLSYHDTEDGDLEFSVKDGFLKSRFWVDEKERSGTPVTFATFEARVSRLRKKSRSSIRR